MFRYLFLIGIFSLTGCATLRSNPIFNIKFSDKPARAFIRSECAGQTFTTQGIVVCEQKAPSQAKVSVKVPPLEGRVVYSNGQLKKTEDFNWYPKEGFFIWKKKPIKDTWIDLDLGEIQQNFGDWPVALDIMAISSVGVINTRGILYHRICNDQDIPCSHMVVQYDCAGHAKATGTGVIGKCDRMSGSPQVFTIPLKTQEYQITSGGRIYISAPRAGFSKTIEITQKEIAAGEIKFDIPTIDSGPTLVGFKASWYSDTTTLKSIETRVLIVGSDPEWTGLDQPHYLLHKEDIDFVKPVLGDLMEVNLYNADKSVQKKKFTGDKVVTFPFAEGSEVLCAFAWQRDSSDLTATCLNSQKNEVKVP